MNPEDIQLTKTSKAGKTVHIIYYKIGSHKKILWEGPTSKLTDAKLDIMWDLIRTQSKQIIELTEQLEALRDQHLITLEPLDENS